MTFEEWFTKTYGTKDYPKRALEKALAEQAWEACKLEAIGHTISETEKWDATRLLHKFVTNLQDNL